MKIHPDLAKTIETRQVDGADLIYCPFCGKDAPYSMFPDRGGFGNNELIYWYGFSCRCEDSHCLFVSTDVNNQIPRPKEELVLDSLHFGVSKTLRFFIQYTQGITEYRALPSDSSVYKAMITKNKAIVPDLSDLKLLREKFESLMYFT